MRTCSQMRASELKIEEYHILWNSRKLQPYQEKLLQSPVYLKISRNNLLSTGPYLSMRENSNMVLFPEYKMAKEQHRNHNIPRRSDLNQARNVIKEFEHPSIQGRTMYSSVIGGSNEEGTWRSTDSAANTDGPATMSDLHSLIQAFISFKKAGTHSLDPKPIIIDSGASHHMISDRNLMSDVQPTSGNVQIANGDKIKIEGIGNLRLFDRESTALYMPQFTSNLLSVRKATVDLSCQVVFRPDEVEFQDLKTGQVIGKGHIHNELYHLQKTEMSRPSTSQCLASTSSGVDSTLWHARLGHPHTRALNLMLPGVVFKNDDCEACISGKHCRTVFSQSSTIYERCFDLVHSDVWTAPCVSRENHKYFVTFIDEKSKYTWVTLIPSKDRVLDAFKNFQTHICNHFNAKMKILRSDNGGEYTSHAFKQYLAQHGITHQTSCPYTPQQNGVAERKNRHLMEVARSMMFHTNVPKKFWSDAVMSATYLINRTPTKVLNDMSPFEVLNKTKPSLDHLRVFGCLCFVMIPGELRNKLDAKSSKAMFIGYSPTQKGYKCYDPESRRVLVSRDVKFAESRGYYNGKSWDELKDLSQSASDRANNLRGLMESLGISMPSLPSVEPVSENLSSTAADSVESTHPNHEGDSRNVEQSTQAQPEESSVAHDQDEMPSESDVETQVEAPSEGNEAKPEQIQLMRRSTRIRKPSQWINTEVYFNAEAVTHPISAVCSLAQYPEDHQVFINELDQEYIPRIYEEAMQLDRICWR
ncbi:hypothetical protein YC2023_077339 [Brassica napus]